MHHAHRATECHQGCKTLPVTNKDIKRKRERFEQREKKSRQQWIMYAYGATERRNGLKQWELLKKSACTCTAETKHLTKRNHRGWTTGLTLTEWIRCTTTQKKKWTKPNKSNREMKSHIRLGMTEHLTKRRHKASVYSINKNKFYQNEILPKKNHRGWKSSNKGKNKPPISLGKCWSS